MRGYRHLFALALAAVLLGASAVHANPVLLPKTMVVQGTATFGKTITTDNPHDGCDAVYGGGLGLPTFGVTKRAYYRFDALVTSSLIADGFLNVCGRVLPMLDNTPTGGIGAACGFMKGHAGQGRISFINPFLKAPTYWLTDVGWKFSMPNNPLNFVGLSGGSFIPITGKIHSGNDGTKGKGKTPVDGLVGLLDIIGGGLCFAKEDPKSDASNVGSRFFVLRGILTVVPNGAMVGNRNDQPTSEKGSNDMPAFCKAAADRPECLYRHEPKKP